MPTTTSQPAARQRAHRLGDRPHRLGGPGPAVTSLAPIMIRATSGARGAPRHLAARSRDTAPDWANATSWTGRSASSTSAAAISTPGVSAAVLHAQPDGAGVTEDGEHQRLAPAAAVDAVAGRRIGLGGRASPGAARPGPPRAGGSPGRPGQPDAAAAVHGPRRQSSGPAGSRHRPSSPRAGGECRRGVVVRIAPGGRVRIPRPHPSEKRPCRARAGADGPVVSWHRIGSSMIIPRCGPTASRSYSSGDHGEADPLVEADGGLAGVAPDQVAAPGGDPDQPLGDQRPAGPEAAHPGSVAMPRSCQDPRPPATGSPAGGSGPRRRSRRRRAGRPGAGCTGRRPRRSPPGAPGGAPAPAAGRSPRRRPARR